MNADEQIRAIILKQILTKFSRFRIIFTTKVSKKMMLKHENTKIYSKTHVVCNGPNFILILCLQTVAKPLGNNMRENVV